ncbi:hypothetical protein NL676_014188 [Syzygium grande]|nr:hypothetical protein NL676_014188 [Syzygium grande]
MHTHFAKRSNEPTHDKPEGKRPTPTSLPPVSKPKKASTTAEQHQIRQNKRGNDAPISFPRYSRVKEQSLALIYLERRRRFAIPSNLAGSHAAEKQKERTVPESRQAERGRSTSEEATRGRRGGDVRSESEARSASEALRVE